MNKYSIIAIIFAVAIGFGAGSVFITQQKNKEVVKLVEEYEKSLKEQNASSQQVIAKMEAEIKAYQVILERDSQTIRDLEYKIKTDGIKYQQKLKDIQKLTPNEKAAWLINRYTIPQSGK